MVKCGLGGEVVQIIKWEDSDRWYIENVEPMALPEAGTYPPNSTSKRYHDERVRLVEIATYMFNDRGWKRHVGTATRIWKANKKPFKVVQFGGGSTCVESFDVRECKRVAMAGELASVLRKLVKEMKEELVSKRRPKEIFFLHWNRIKNF